MPSTSSSVSVRSARSRGHLGCALDDGEIAHPAQQPPAMRGVPRERRAISFAPVGAYAERQHARAARDDQLQLFDRVEIQTHRNAETVAQRRRQQAGPRRRADEREAREIDLHRTRRRPFADDEVELEILHRGIKNFLHRRIEPMDFVDEQHVSRLQIR